METVAVLGANGFIGNRIVERYHVLGSRKVRPIVRTASSAARLSRFDLPVHVADALDEHALEKALRGCQSVVHAVAGSADFVASAAVPAYRAAQRAGVNRLIYLSSASVHGQSPVAGTTEETPLNDRQPIAYNNAKIHAERSLLKGRASGTTEVVILRPGIVFGPRSFWIGSFADQLLAGQAYLIGRGNGICNSIYVDNLVHAIDLAIQTSGIDRQAFLVGDQETVTWADLYRPVAQALGFNVFEVAQVPPNLSPEKTDRIGKLRSQKFFKATVRLVPYPVRVAIKAGLKSLRRTETPLPGGAPNPAQSIPQATYEMSLLQCCRYKLPSDKAVQMLGYRPPVSFAEGCRRSVGWLSFAGYPVTSGARATPQSKPCASNLGNP